MKTILVNLDDDLTKINNVLKMSLKSASVAMLDLIYNMLYWDSSWAKAKSSIDVLVDNHHYSYADAIAVANPIYQLHMKIDKVTKCIPDKQWMFFDVHILLHTEDQFQINIVASGDYRVIQWTQEHNAELAADGSLECSSRAGRLPVHSDKRKRKKTNGG